MKRPAIFLRRLSWAWVCSTLLWPSPGLADSGRWKTKTKELAAYFPAPTEASGSPELLVVPLLGPARELLPGGKLIVWVGRNDGTPLVDANVTVRVPVGDNPLLNGGSRVDTVTLQTDASGLATVLLTAPDVPKPKKSRGSGGGSGGGGPEE